MRRAGLEAVALAGLAFAITLGAAEALVWVWLRGDG
jgi:hypothetical protein